MTDTAALQASVFKNFDQQVKKHLQALDLEGLTDQALSRIAVEPPRDPAHGDLAVNAAMVLAKPLGLNPRELAAKLAERLEGEDGVQSVQVAGPGFINLRLTNEWWGEHLRRIVRLGGDFGRNVIPGGKKVNVEYVSANPTGPMHVGHCRGAVVGDSLANLLAFAGFEVTKEYVINDAGVQIGVLARSVELRYREALGEKIGEIPEGLYPGDYLVPVGKALADEFGDRLQQMDEAERMAILRDRSIEAMMALIKEDLSLLNVHHDIFFSERTLHEKRNGVSEIDRMLQEMREAGYVFEGRLPPPKGEVPEDWEDREQTLFRSTEVGDDMDRPLIKSDGSYTYFAADVAYFRDKYVRGYDRMVYVLGADHGGYVKRLKAVARAVAGDKAELDVLLTQLVKLYRDGEPVRMSKRAGDFVTLRDVVEEVGVDAVRFMMLYRKPEAPLDFDFAKVTEQSKDNPVFYVQYAHARCCSVLRQAASEIPRIDLSRDALAAAGMALLTDEGELALIRKMAEYPRIIEQAALADEPHRIAFYLHELASDLHSHWNRGKEMSELRFINPKNANLTLARMALLHALSEVLASGLGIVGASAPQEMR
ncbi:MAG: arginine--tRNA ligase [Phyllobacteriaceae bacterium]|nr:arginine--tRNA ligase [Phyllobacteriaceae bacterium]